MHRCSLSDAFRSGARDPDGAHSPSLEGMLNEYIAAARSRWPAIDIDEVDFASYLGARARERRPPSISHAADLLLAYACGLGIKTAIDAFHREHKPVIDRVLSHRGALADVAADVRQSVYARLLVGDVTLGIAPKIAAYSGIGPLRSWVASTAATTLMMLRRSEGRRRERAKELDDVSLGASVDMELGYLKGRYRADVEQAIADGLAQLGARERTLLRLHLGDKMSIDALGALYSVNRATAARWLAAARRSLVKLARDTVRERLHLSDSECNSVLALVRSQLNISILRRLSEGSSDDPIARAASE